MKATIRIVTPAAATAAAALLLTACADKPVRIPGGAFVEEPSQGETITRTQTQTIPSNGTETVETEIIYIDTDLPVGPVEDDSQGGLAGLRGGDQLQPIEQQPETKSNVPEGSVEYKVVKGDTLWGISMVYGVSMDRLAEINGIDKNSTLRIGQVLMIPPDVKNAVGKPIPQKKTDSTKASATDKKTTTSTTKSSSATTTKTDSSAKTPATKDGEELYVVKKGDNLSTIAYRHHVKLNDLIAANKIDPKSVLRIGQTLVIPAAGTKAASTTTTTKSNVSSSTGVKTDSAAATTTKSGSATTTKTDSAASTTKKSSDSTQKAGEGTGGVVEPLGGTSFSGSSTSTATTRPATTTTTPSIQPASSGSSLGLAPVSATPDAGVLPIVTEFDSTIEDLADYHGRSLVEMMRLNPQYKTGQRIPRGTSINLPFE